MVGEGHFGGDGKQPQVTLRMHARHESLFRWLEDEVPGSKVYGPYNHSGRHYMQWMARGRALRQVLVPLLDSFPWETIDSITFEKYSKMKRDYGIGSSTDE